MKAKTIWHDWWKLPESLDWHMGYGLIGLMGKPRIVFGLAADVRWVNVWGKVGDNVNLEEGSKIIGDE